MAFRSFFSLFSNSQLSFSSFEVSGKGSVLISRYQHINSVGFSNALTHPHDKYDSFQFIQRTRDRHGVAGQDGSNGCDREADKQEDVYKRQALSCKTSLRGCFLGGSLLSSVPGVAFRTQ